MAKSFKAEQNTISKIIETYSAYQTSVNNDSIIFKATTNSFSVIVYANNTVLFQGVDAESECAKWYIEKTIPFEEHIGSDEVGCGDYFGPIVVAATYVSNDNVGKLIELGVKDSKQLSDSKILEIAPKVMKIVKYLSFTLTNTKYNELTNNEYNLNKIKAYAHNFLLYKLVNKLNFKGLVVVDQFCDEKLFYDYLDDYKVNDVLHNIYFTIKAENKYLAVACASIIARYIFLQEIDKLSKDVNHQIILGASSKVDELASIILKEKGVDYLKSIVKWNFKNTSKLEVGG